MQEQEMLFKFMGWKKELQFLRYSDIQECDQQQPGASRRKAPTHPSSQGPRAILASSPPASHTALQLTKHNNKRWYSNINLRVTGEIQLTL